jgi:translin
MLNNLENISNQARQDLTARDAAREKMLPLCREVIRCSGNAIRAVHRQDYKLAMDLLAAGRGHLSVAAKSVESYGELGNTGAIRDAQKELAEANITLSIVTGRPLPGPKELSVDTSAYLNGLGEAVGELRRYMLDAMRKGDLSRGEELLTTMDDIYSVLVTIDFPDAVTGGLRRTTDMVRGVLERTRSDLTLAMQQKALETRLAVYKPSEGSPPQLFTPPKLPLPEVTTATPTPAPAPDTEPAQTIVDASQADEPKLNEIEQTIYNALVEWRTRKSIEEHVAPYIIAHNSVLKEIVKLRPTTAKELTVVKSLGERRVNKYGKEIIAIINKDY